MGWRRGGGGRKRGKRCRRAETEARGEMGLVTSIFDNCTFEQRRASPARQAAGITPPARGRSCACRASPCCATPTWRRNPGSRPARRERTRRRGESRVAAMDVLGQQGGLEFIARSRGKGVARGDARERDATAWRRTRLWTGNPTREDAGCRRRERVRAGGKP